MYGDFIARAITNKNDYSVTKTENWSWCVCQECGTWHKVWYPTTAGGLCPRCKEEMKKKFNFTFKNEITG